VNAVVLIGNLATEVSVRDVAGDKRVADFLLAVDRRTRDGGADFIRIVAWDRQADLCAQYLAKGRRVAVEGSLRTRTWEDQGTRRRDTEVVARSVQFLSPPTESENGGAVPFEAAVA
jgi:single-strand DNA-binding protein